MKNKQIVITLGDPNGIGTEITIKALQAIGCEKEIVIVGNKSLLDFYGGSEIISKYEIVELPFEKNDIKCGEISSLAGSFAFNSIKTACELTTKKQIKALVTAPVSKTAMNLAGFNYSGQTEILEKCLAHDNQKAQMLICAKKQNLLLLTRHIPLEQVSTKLTKELVINTIKQTFVVFQEKFKIQNPKFALCALNPHAGEEGLLGKEEQNILIPAIEEIKSLNIDINGPFPADAFFAKIAETYWSKNECDYNCIFTPYHDQGLIPIKMLAGKKAVNTTIGLDIIRTSPAHGTAFDIAGKNIADATSMIEALKFALNI